jgi:hypothetical protein
MSSPPKEQGTADAKPRSPFPFDVLKISALGGALLYGVLFLGYYNYYEKLGLHPEDLGVSYTYILVRSIGFIVLISMMLGLMSMIYLSTFETADTPDSEAVDTPHSKSHVLRSGLLYCILLLYLIILTPRNWPGFIGGLISVAVITILMVAGAFARESRIKGLLVFSVLALLATIIFPTAVVVNRANDLARQALAGHPVAPYELFGVPILDVSARTVTVTWIGSADQRPAILGKQSPEPIQGLLLGLEAGTAVLLIRNPHKTEIVKFPSALVVIEDA